MHTAGAACLRRTAERAIREGGDFIEALFRNGQLDDILREADTEAAIRYEDGLAASISEGDELLDAAMRNGELVSLFDQLAHQPAHPPAQLQHVAALRHLARHRHVLHRTKPSLKNSAAYRPSHEGVMEIKFRTMPASLASSD